MNARAEWSAHLAYSTVRLSSAERCKLLTIPACGISDAAAQTYLQLLDAATWYPFDRRLRWAPAQFAARYEAVERQHAGRGGMN